MFASDIVITALEVLGWWVLLSFPVALMVGARLRQLADQDEVDLEHDPVLGNEKGRSC